MGQIPWIAVRDLSFDNGSPPMGRLTSTMPHATTHNAIQFRTPTVRRSILLGSWLHEITQMPDSCHIYLLTIECMGSRYLRVRVSAEISVKHRRTHEVHKCHNRVSVPNIEVLRNMFSNGGEYCHDKRTRSLSIPTTRAIPRLPLSMFAREKSTPSKGMMRRSTLRLSHDTVRCGIILGGKTEHASSVFRTSAPQAVCPQHKKIGERPIDQGCPWEGKTRALL